MTAPWKSSSTRSLVIIMGAALGTASGCAMAPPPQAAAPYQPNFAYRPEVAKKKLDVTVGIIGAQWSANGALYRESFKNDEILKNMLSSMAASFNEILLAKGFNTKGPFTSLNDMTFPEKKGSDLLLYPEFDFQIEMRTENERNLVPPAAAGTQVPSSRAGELIALMGAFSGPSDPYEKQTCDVLLSVSGNLLFVAQEPLSGERMWIKRLDVSKGKETFRDQHGRLCSDIHMLNQDMKNAWAKAHELVYQSSMKALDNYVNGEEFQMLKRQSLDLRARKTY